MSFRCLVSGMAAIAAVAVLNLSSRADEGISFATQIRPILSDKCFQCHGPDQSHREAGLRFD